MSKLPSVTPGDYDFLVAGGACGKVLQQVAWSDTGVADMAHWPQSLRTSLSICLSSRYPICILWGPSRTYLYNDAYAPIVGAKHPWALGRPYPEVWPEIWDSAIRPLLEEVERSGQASWSDSLLLVLNRHGFAEECYFDFSFAPIWDQGLVAGVFTAIMETTTSLVDERRMRCLRAIETQQAVSVAVAWQQAMTALAEFALEIPFAVFYELDDDQQTARRVAVTGLEAAAAPAVVPLQGRRARTPGWPG